MDDFNLKVSMAQIPVYPGQPARNAQTILQDIDKAKEEKADIVIFPELSLPGYLIGDLWEVKSFLTECTYWQNIIIKKTEEIDTPVVIFGTVVTDPSLLGEDGRAARFNSVIVAQNGKAIINSGLQRPYAIKSLSPNYRGFDETRYFMDARKYAFYVRKPWEELIAPFEVSIKGQLVKLGVLICEDGWDDDYIHKPIEQLAKKKSDIIIQINLSPFSLEKEQKRQTICSRHASKIQKPYFYVNGSCVQDIGKTVYVFDGMSAFYNKKGQQVKQLPGFQRSFETIELKNLSSPDLPFFQVFKSYSSFHDIYQSLHFALKEFLKERGIKRVVIGSSGGIDSAVSAVLYRTVLEPNNLLLVNMPSRFNSSETKNASKELAKNLGCLYAEVSIEESVSLTLSQIEGLTVSSIDQTWQETLHLSPLNQENIQARDRSSRILAALSSAFGGVFTCNVNKAELTVGYGTLYGDLGGFLAILGDLWKYQVYELGRYLNEVIFKKEVIPSFIFNVVPSAELSLSQDITKGQGDPFFYPYHDRLFASWVESWDRKTPEEILELYLVGALSSFLKLPEGCSLKSLFLTTESFILDLEKWWILFCTMGVAKRIQAPPLVSLSRRTYGFDFREHQGGVFFSTAYQRLKAKALKST